jgi:WD40 repeat protein
LLSADRKRLAVNSRDGQLWFLDPQTLELIESTTLPDGAATIRDVGSDWLATLNFPTGVSTPLRAISLYSLPEMELLATLPGSWAQSNPTGDHVAIDEGPGHVSILDTSTGEKVIELRGGSGRVRGLAFSPDGALLMTSATDGFMRIWEVGTGTEIERIPLGDDFEGSGDGYWLDDDTVAMALGRGRWTNVDIGLDSLLELARSRILRTLTQAECGEYEIDPCPTLDQLRGG